MKKLYVYYQGGLTVGRIRAVGIEEANDKFTNAGVIFTQKAETKSFRQFEGSTSLWYLRVKPYSDQIGTWEFTVREYE